MNEYETYIDTIEEIENRVVDDTKYPVITDIFLLKGDIDTLEEIEFYDC